MGAPSRRGHRAAVSPAESVEQVRRVHHRWIRASIPAAHAPQCAGYERVDAVSVVSKLVHAERTMVDDVPVARHGFAAWSMLWVGSRSAAWQLGGGPARPGDPRRVVGCLDRARLSYYVCYRGLMALRVKRSISLPPDLAAAIDEAAAAHGTTVSGWIAATAAHRLRMDAGRRGIAEWERENGPLTSDELVAGLARAQAVLGRKPVLPRRAS